MGKFRRHSHADRPFSYSIFLRCYKSWPVETKRKSSLCRRWRSSVGGHKFSSPESLEWV